MPFHNFLKGKSVLLYLWRTQPSISRITLATHWKHQKTFCFNFSENFTCVLNNSNWDHCQRFLASQFPHTLKLHKKWSFSSRIASFFVKWQIGSEPAQNLSCGFVERSPSIVNTPRDSFPYSEMKSCLPIDKERSKVLPIRAFLNKRSTRASVAVTLALREVLSVSIDQNNNFLSVM